MLSRIGRFSAILVLATAASHLAGAAEPARVTILYDAFGPQSPLTKDWGFAALVEYGGKRVLFDTGNDAEILEHNVKRLGVDLSRLDAVVISHRHGDHTSGLGYVLRVNPDVGIFAPQEGAFFGSVPPTGFLARHPGLPEDLRYYDGHAPQRWATGTPWEGADFSIVNGTTEILPGIHALTTRSQKPGTLEMNELSLAIRTPLGLAVVVGCSHPGVETILQAAVSIDSRIYTVLGGFHLVMTTRDDIERTAEMLAGMLKVQRVAPGHCTSELGFSVFRDRFDERFDRAGVGDVIPLP